MLALKNTILLKIIVREALSLAKIIVAKRNETT